MDFNTPFNCSARLQSPRTSVAAALTEEHSLLAWSTVFPIIIFSAIIVATLVGNCMVIASVFLYGPLRTVQNFFIVSLAFADLTVAVFVLPLSVAYWSTDRWTYGRGVCQMWLTMDILCCTSSILHLCVIALDRYRAITSPIDYAQKRNIPRVLSTIVLVWLVSILISFPPLLGWNDWPQHFTDSTPCTLTQERLFVLYSSSGSFFIPLAIMGVLYAKIFRANRQRFRVRSKRLQSLVRGSLRQSFEKKSSDERISQDENQPKDEGGVERAAKETIELRDTRCIIRTVVSHTNTTTTVSAFVEQKHRIYLSQERKAARVLGIIMGVFVVCWLPFFLMYVIVPFCSVCSPARPEMVVLVTWLGYLNSSLNPVIYTVFNRDFRKAFTMLASLQLRKLRSSV